MDDLQAVIDEIQKRLDTNFGGSEDWELGRRAELCYLLQFVVNLSKQEPNYIYSTSTGKEFENKPAQNEDGKISCSKCKFGVVWTKFYNSETNGEHTIFICEKDYHVLLNLDSCDDFERK